MTERIPKERLDDQKIMEQIIAFQHWARTAEYDVGSGILNIMDFIKSSLEDGASLYSRMYTRQCELARTMAQKALQLPDDGALAADFLSEKLHRDPVGMDYSPPLFICGRYLELLAKSDRGRGSHCAATYNTIFGYGLSTRHTKYWVIGTKRDLKDDYIQVLERPLIVDVLHLGINIPMFVDSMQIGVGAWGEGRDIALSINEHITSEASQGQLCSLWPPTGATKVDWRKNTWAYDSRFLELCDDNDRANKPLPDWVKEMMR